MKFAIWCAVSTIEQAKDEKDSLPEQERKCRAVGQGKGWTEAVQPFVVPGESRTRWVNLRDAEAEIPALHAMLEAAKRHEFDLVVLYDYNRLRDLLDPVAKTLASYGVQIYSVNQPVEPLPPQEFNMYASDSESMMRGMAQIISRWQIADLRRKYWYGLTARVMNGLPSTRVPYGYRKNGNGVPHIDPEQSAVIIEIKNMFLAGISMRSIERHLNATYPTARGADKWAPITIRQILLNPFYAGRVYFGLSKRINDPRNNTRKIVKNDNPTIAEGKHDALWTWEDYQAILLEFERRKDLPTMNKYTFTGLLRCSICDRPLHHWKHDNRWRCRYNYPEKYHVKRDGRKNKNHILLSNDEANQLIPQAIQQAVIEATIRPIPSPAKPVNSQELDELNRQKKKIQEGFEHGIYSAAEAEAKIKVIKAKIDELKDVNRQKERQAAEIRLAHDMLEEIRELNEDLPSWIVEEDPAVANRLLLRLLEKVVISPEKKVVKVVFRGMID